MCAGTGGAVLASKEGTAWQRVGGGGEDAQEARVEGGSVFRGALAAGGGELHGRQGPARSRGHKDCPARACL